MYQWMDGWIYMYICICILIGWLINIYNQQYIYLSMQTSIYSIQLFYHIYATSHSLSIPYLPTYQPTYLTTFIHHHVVIYASQCSYIPFTSSVCTCCVLSSNRNTKHLPIVHTLVIIIDDDDSYI